MGVFSIRAWLSRQQRRQERKEPRERRARPRTPPNATVMIVDDSRTMVFSLRKTLEQGGYRVTQAFDGESCLERAQTEHPDIILLDIVMPGINGYETLRRLRRNEATRHIPVILMSGTDQSTERFWGEKLGARSFLTKPIARGDLFLTLEGVVRAA